MSITAKSVIIDVANNHGGDGLGLRAVEFFLSGSLVAVSEANAAYYVTSQYSVNYAVKFVFLPLSKTGTASDTNWYTATSTCQRLIIVFNDPVEFDRIDINNSHETGTNTTQGAKDVEVYYSPDDITDTTYGAAISDGVQLFDGVFDQHTAADIVDSQTLTFYSISGTVTEDGTPVARIVRIYKRSTGVLVSQATSLATTGVYSFTVDNLDAHYIVVLDDDLGTDYNALITDRVVGSA